MRGDPSAALVRLDGLCPGLGPLFIPDLLSLAGGFLRCLGAARGTSRHHRRDRDDDATDGRLVLTGSDDRTARLWDAATGQPIGPAFLHERQVWFVAIAPNGRSMISGGQERRGHLRDVPRPMDLPADEVEPAVQAATGMELLDDGSLQVLGADGWQSRREQSPAVSLVRDRTASRGTGRGGEAPQDR